ncbi:MAG TPA: hypothetical protein PLQ28_00310 [Flexilinea sp.]|nr:hypothetical protein [Flexilinea sp.]HOW06248.1 hypothetical protein [Flexilinea sp.]HPS47396.1 hypothetical protein [Flexilinea sp.]
MQINKLTDKLLVLFVIGCIFVFLFASCSILTGLQEVDPQSATLTALVTPTSVQPTLDLKGNKVLEDRSCLIFDSPSISTFADAEDGGIFAWAGNKNLLAFVVPENRYWAWFSGDAEIVDFEKDYKNPAIMNTTGLKVFGDFAFNPSATKIAFVVLRTSEKIYTVVVATLSSNLQTTIDLFTDTSARTDNYSSSKSVIQWENDDEVTVTTSCGIDCDQIYRINTVTGTTRLIDEVRKKGHTGRDFPQNVPEYDEREYPAMNQPNWSPDLSMVFYTDDQNKTWILNDKTKEQFELPITADKVLQTAWSHDAQFIAIRFAENLSVYKVNCK